METIVLFIVVALAVGYLYRRFSSALKTKTPSCGCGECGAQCSKGLTACGNNNAFGISVKNDKDKDSDKK
jgi:hypothetical protein